MKCEIDQCTRQSRSRGLCHTHYMQWWSKERPTPKCSVNECNNKTYAKGMCGMHRRRVLRYGDANIVHDARSMTTKQYIEWHTERDDQGCWLWTGALQVAGYGKASRNNKSISAHRMSYVEYKGDIPAKCVVRHKCDVRRCVNPDHLEVGTRADNNKDTSIRDRHGNAKLKNQDVIDIRWMHGLGATGASLARAYGVTATLISQVVNRKARTNV